MLYIYFWTKLSIFASMSAYICGQNYTFLQLKAFTKQNAMLQQQNLLYELTSWKV